MAIDAFEVLSAPAVVNGSNLWFVCAKNSSGAQGGTKENQMFGMSGDSGSLQMND